MKFNKTFIYEDEFSNEDENLYDPNNPYLVPPEQQPVEQVDAPENYYEDEEELPPLPNKDASIAQTSPTDPVTGIPPEEPFYEDEPNDLYQQYMNQPPQEPLATPTYEDEIPEDQEFVPNPSEMESVPAYEDESPELATPQIQGPPLNQSQDMGMQQPAMSPDTVNPTGVPSFEDETQVAQQADPSMQQGMDPNAQPPADPNMDPNSMTAPDPSMDPNAMPPQDPAMGMDPSMMGGEMSDMGGGYDSDPYTSTYTDEKHPELRVGNSSEVTSGRPVSVEDISRINELKKINSQLMRIRGLLEKELKYKYNKVEDKLNEAIEYFRVIITNLDSYVNQVDDIIMKYKRFIMTLLTQINVLKQQEINEN